MKPPLVIIGLGQLGHVFARGFLKCGHPVYPMQRNANLAEEASRLPDPALVLIAVSETDLEAVLQHLPNKWRQRVGLLQNELLPYIWQDQGLNNPTVCPIWFEKKAGNWIKVTLPTPIYGPQAELLQSALAALAVPTRLLAEPWDLTLELVKKNLYILTLNIAGLVVGETAGELWSDHRDLALAVSQEILDIQESLLGAALPREQLLQDLATAIAARPEQKTTGRSAPARLTRAWQQAKQAGLTVPRLRQIHEQETAVKK